MKDAERCQEAMLKILARKRAKILDKIDYQKRQLEKVEARMNIAGDPNLFEKNTGHLAMTHETTKQYISTIRQEVRQLSTDVQGV